MRNLQLLGVLSILVNLAIAQLGAATIPAFTVDILSWNATNRDYTEGWEFTTTQQTTVSMLGVFDADSGLPNSVEVGIWAPCGGLLGSVTIPSGDSSLTINQFEYVALQGGPISLAAGQTYEIGALYTFADPVAGIRGIENFMTNPAIVFDEATFADGATLKEPDQSLYTLPGYFGPNFLITTDGPETELLLHTEASVPEPPTFVLSVLSCLMLGLMLRSAFKERQRVTASLKVT